MSRVSPPWRFKLNPNCRPDACNRYAFDYVFDATATQRAVYENTTKFLIQVKRARWLARAFRVKRHETGNGSDYRVGGSVSLLVGASVYVRAQSGCFAEPSDLSQHESDWTEDDCG